MRFEDKNSWLRWQWLQNNYQITETMTAELSETNKKRSSQSLIGTDQVKEWCKWEEGGQNGKQSRMGLRTGKEQWQKKMKGRTSDGALQMMASKPIKRGRSCKSVGGGEQEWWWPQYCSSPDCKHLSDLLSNTSCKGALAHLVTCHTPKTMAVDWQTAIIYR